jgi:ABC-type hemin transport system ATPase subunit
MTVKSPGDLMLQMLTAYRELVKREGHVVVVLYGDNLAAVLDPDAPRVQALIKGIDEETEDGGS